MKKIIVAIDGHSSCGKSTMAKALAKEIGYIYVDTGAMYRAVTYYALQNELYQDAVLNQEELEKNMPAIHISFKLNEATGVADTYLNGVNVEKEIRSMWVANKVSEVSTLAFVREALVAQQRELGKGKGIVMDGRDIGTVVFPQAELKVFVTAKAEVRAERRWKELQAKGEPLPFKDVLENVMSRDKIDSTRAVSPLKQAEDALVLDNSDMTIPEQHEWLLDVFYHRVIG